MKMADTVDELASRCMVDGRMQREVLVGGGVKFVVMSSRSRMVPVIGWEA